MRLIRHTQHDKGINSCQRAKICKALGISLTKSLFFHKSTVNCIGICRFFVICAVSDNIVVKQLNDVIIVHLGSYHRQYIVRRLVHLSLHRRYLVDIENIAHVHSLDIARVRVSGVVYGGGDVKKSVLVIVNELIRVKKLLESHLFIGSESYLFLTAKHCAHQLVIKHPVGVVKSVIAVWVGDDIPARVRAFPAVSELDVQTVGGYISRQRCLRLRSSSHRAHSNSALACRCYRRCDRGNSARRCLRRRQNSRGGSGLGLFVIFGYANLRNVLKGQTCSGRQRCFAL